MDKVRFGIVGLGGIAKRFAAVLRRAPSARLYAAAARDPARAEAFAAEYGAERSYGSYKELIGDPEVDVVYIALTHNLHYELIKECLLGGKRVLCEKPMVLTRDKAKVLCSLAGKKNLFLMEGMWTRFLPAVRTAAEWVRAGRIGGLRMVEASFCSRAKYNPASRLFDPALSGGVLYDMGVYPILFATGIVGENPVEAVGTAAMAPTGVDCCDSLSLRFPCGAVAALRCATSVHMPRDGVLYGTQGRILLPDFYKATSAILYNEAGEQLDRFEEPCEDGFIYEIEHVASLIRAGKIESEYMPWRDTIACAEIFDTMRERWGIAGAV